MIYYVIRLDEEGAGDNYVAFEDFDRAKLVFEEWNRSHESDYTLSTEREVSDAALMRGRAVTALL